MALALPRSLRARMLWSLLATIVVGALIQGVSAYRTALAETDQIFDYNMQQMALSLRSGIPLVNPGAADEFEGFGSFDFVVQVWTQDGIRIFESSRSLALPQRAVLGFSNIQVGGGEYRVYSIRTSSRVIQVAQDLDVRRRMAGGLAVRTVGPIAMMVPLLMLVTWWVVTRSLRPVSRVRAQVARRAADDLSPVSEEDLPDEVGPLVRELNLLLGRVRSAFEAQRNFVADAAHELRSPLAALSLQVQGLRRAQDELSRQVAVDRLAAGVVRATRLIEQLLVLARQEASVASGEPAGQVELLGLARSEIAETHARARSRGIDLGVAEGSAQATVQGQPEALAILLRNLLDNAVKYTPRGGEIDVGVFPGPILRVEDSGPGIPEELRDRVLARFDRSGSAASAASGSGLGLAIVKAIAERHGARLVLSRSERLGGLRVEVRFAPQAAAGA
jgi:two-component system OmpR family sensor kinase